MQRLLLPFASTCLASALALNSHASELEEVLVTAELRTTELLAQSASTSVVGAEAISQRAAQHLEDILNLTPNVNFAGGSSRARFYQIRGIGERSQFQDPLNPSIGFIVDGIDFSGLGTAGTLFDIEQVEVLRGPQGTLHGANALAGLINVRSAAPSAEPSFRVEAMAADYDTWSLGAVGSGPLIADTLLYRIAVQQYASDGFTENDHLNVDDTQERDETTVRGKLRWLPSERDTVDFTAMYIDIDNGYDAFSLDNTRHTLSDEPGHDRQESTALAVNWQREMSTTALQARATYATSDTDYAYDEDWAFVGIAPESEYSSFDQYLRDRDSYSAELRLLSQPEGRWFGGRSDWVIGAYYLANREDLRRRYTYLSEDFTSSYDTDTLAVFAQLDTALSERLSLITGVRYERRGNDYSDSNDVSSDPEKGLWGGKLGFEYSLNPRGIAYFTVSRGYRAHGVNPTILASLETTEDPEQQARLRRATEFDEEFLINWELGYKSEWFDRRVRARAATFYMDRQDQQVKGSLVIPREDGSTSFLDYTDNAAEGNNYGLELELDWLVSDSLSVYAHLGWLETEFEDYVNADDEDLSGREQAHAPGYQFAVGGRFDFGAGFYGRIDVEGKDDFYFSDRHDVQAPAYELVHARLGYAGEHWELALWGRNLTDEDYYVRGFGSFGNDPRKGYITEPYYQFGEPRMIGVSASYQF